MVKYKNYCCACATPAYPCRGSSCPLRSVPVYYCDNCKREIEGDVNEDADEHFCEKCAKTQDEDEDEDDD